MKLVHRWLLAAVGAGLLLLLIQGVRSLEPATPGKPSLTVAALDIGSGSTRLLVAELEACGGEILQVLERMSVRVSYGADQMQSPTGAFSEDIQKAGDRAIEQLTSRARELGAELVFGIATQAFRLAGNGDDLLQVWRERYGLQARILTQDEEARLAYQWVASRRSSSSSPFLVWDIGAGSQQLVWRDASSGDWVHVNSDLASVTFRNHALFALGRPPEHSSPNPISSAEADHLAKEVESWLNAVEAGQVSAAADQGYEIVAIGGVHGISLVNQLGLKAGEPITRSGLDRALARQLGRSDEELGGEYADTDVSNLILVGALMDGFGIENYQVMANDLTEALLLALDEDCQLAFASDPAEPGE